MCTIFVVAQMKQLCRVEVLGKFADYLYELKDGDEIAYACGSALQHLSGAKLFVERLCGGNCWQECDPSANKVSGTKFNSGRGGSEEWYTDMRNSTSRLFMLRCLDKGSVRTSHIYI
jgi:hypothetical protein